MSLDLSAVGRTSPRFLHQYGFNELALYALSVGATPERELALLLETHDNPWPMPLYAVICAWSAVEWQLKQLGCDRQGVLHLGQRVTWHRPIPLQGTLHTKSRIVAVYDLRRAAQSVIFAETWDEEDHLVTETEWTMIHLREGGFEGAPPPQVRVHRPPLRARDREIAIETSPAQAALYRLNGDLNPLHLDPKVAANEGFERPILHGLCTLAMAALALSRAAVPLVRLTYLEASFRAPVYPGDTLISEAWTEENETWFQAHTTPAPKGLAIRHGYMKFGPERPWRLDEPHA